MEHEAVPKQDWEYETVENTVSVKGKLAEKVEFWREVIQAPSHYMY